MTHRSRGTAPLAVGLLVLSLGAACSKKDDEQPNYGDRIVTAYDRGKVSGARGDLQTLAVAITQYVSAEGSLPEAEDVDQLAALLAPTFVRRAPRVDPWGTAYAYQTDGQSYWITSAGHDRELDTADDVEVEDGQVTKLPEGYERIR
jgi:hypothetical protein